MLLGMVVGTVVSSRKEEKLTGLKLLLVRPADETGRVDGKLIVAADAVGAGTGELVLYAAGSSARQTEATTDRPVDHVVMAIVDEVEVEGQLTFRKDG